MLHTADTLKQGCFLNDCRAVEVLCKNAPAAVMELQEFGVDFAKDNDRLAQRFLGGHTYRRACFVADHTGAAAEAALANQAEKRKIQFLENMYITSLTKHEGSVSGAVGFDTKTNDTVAFNSKTVVIAAGGCSQIYKRSTRPMENTSNGISLAFEAGAELQDMEMVQFHPTGMVWPKAVDGALVTEAVRAEGGILYNDKGERFMEDYDSINKELGPRDVVARAIQQEIASGKGSRHHGVWLDIRHKELGHIMERLPSVYGQFLKHGIDITKDFIEVAPSAHFSMGGIRVGLDGRTSVQGLYAAGEAAAGLHGANKLGGNSLAEAMVFGKIAGRAAAENAKQTKLTETDYSEIMSKAKKAHLSKSSSENVQKMKKHLQEIMWRHAGIVRSAEGLHTALRHIEAMKKKVYKMQASANRDPDFWNLNNMIIAAEAVARSALLRKESRGAHFRKDYPVQDDRMLFNIVCQNDNGMKLRTVKVPHPHEQLLRTIKNMPEPRYETDIENEQ
jgi:succinate dehydrogenase/fumarate reductase flavoprotein subunit